MAISYGVTNEFKCQYCDSITNFKVWFIVDSIEWPDLMEKIITEEIHVVYCHKCSRRIESLDKPLMVYNHSADPVLIYCPSEETTTVQDEFVFDVLKTKFLEQFKTIYPQESQQISVLRLPRCALSVFLKEGLVAAEEKSRQEEMERGNSRQEYLDVINRFLDARSLVEFRDVIVPHYEMITSFRAFGYINEIIEAATGREKNYFSSKKNLLTNYRNIGFEKTKADLERLAGYDNFSVKAVFGKLKEIFHIG